MIAGVAAVAMVLATPITLDEVRAAARNNLDALNREIAVQQAQQGVYVARSAIWPQLTVQGNFGALVQGRNKSLQPTFQLDDQGVPVLGPEGDPIIIQAIRENPYQFSFANLQLSATVSQLIYDGGKWWNQISQAKSQVDVAQGQLDEQRLVSEFEAVRRFYLLLQAQTQLEVLQSAEGRSKEQVERANALYGAGRAVRLDAINAEVNLGTDQIATLRQQQTIAAAQASLLQWLGRPSSPIEAVNPGRLGVATVPSLEQSMNVAKDRRPLLAALQADVVQNERAVDVAWSNYLPQVSLQASYIRQGNSADPFFTDPTYQNGFQGGLRINWNVFSGFQTQAQVAQNEAAVTKAKFTLDQARAALENDVRNSIAALDVQTKVVKVAESNLSLAQSSLKLAEERFNAGAASNIDVRDAQQKLTQAQLIVVNAQVDVEIARAALYRMVGANVESKP